LAGSTSKKVIAVRFDREPIAGYVNPQTYLQPEGVEVLTSGGSVAVLPYPEVKAVCFVREAGSGEPWRRHLAFTTRPKSAGLWVRFYLRDGDSIDGLVPSDLLTLEAQGFTITPPDAGGASPPRIFIPKSAISQTEVLGVIGVAKRAASRKAVERADQLKMFE
jgi:hypothetical protein